MIKLIVILGPTAAGKTDLALFLAKKFNGYIISVDSRQIYRGMDIATGKLPFTERQGIIHRMIDIIDPNQEFSLAQYQRVVFSIIKQEKTRLPFLVGGTGLYIQAVVDNLSIPQGPPDKVLRKKLEQKTAHELFKELVRLDPEAARMIDENNKRRIIRAIEVVKKTGRKFTSQLTTKKPIVTALQLGLKIPREVLYQNIEKRVDKMMAQGLVAETKRLGEKYGYNIPSMSAIGYQQIGLFLQRKLSQQEAIEQIKRETRNYAKRQMTWFKRDKRIHWIENKEEAEELIEDFIK